MAASKKTEKKEEEEEEKAFFTFVFSPGVLQSESISSDRKNESNLIYID